MSGDEPDQRHATPAGASHSGVGGGTVRSAVCAGLDQTWQGERCFRRTWAVWRPTDRLSVTEERVVPRAAAVQDALSDEPTTT
jgi:hypothetical protein